MNEEQAKEIIQLLKDILESLNRLNNNTIDVQTEVERLNPNRR